MTVICNATPLINFAAIDRLDILLALFRQVLIPHAVYIETTSLTFPSSHIVLQAIESGWLIVQTVSSINNNIPVELDAGEREVITLAIEKNERKVLLDEQEARKTAQNLGLRVIGSLGVLLLAKNNQIIPQVKPLLDAMMNEAQYWVSYSLYYQVLQQAGE